MNSIMGGVPQTKGRKVKLKKIIKLKHAHNNTISNNPLIYIILLEKSKKFFTMPDCFNPPVCFNPIQAVRNQLFKTINSNRNPRLLTSKGLLKCPSLKHSAKTIIKSTKTSVSSLPTS